MRLANYLLLIAAIAATLGSIGLHGQLQAERAAHQETKSRYARQVAEAEHLRADEESKRRKAQQELTHAQEVHAQKVATLHLDLDRARAANRVADQRMRDATAAAAARARAQCAAATAADLREAAGDPIGVLADVLGRADERASLLADLADRRGVAGRACEREYDAAREKLKEH
jgi:vacuolar-type H+-ATPase subunit I/STV1